MRLGVVLPQPELGPDPVALGDFVQAAETIGYNHVVLYEIVLKTHDIVLKDRERSSAPNNWHDPFILMSYLAGLTSKLRFTTGVTILPSRPTVLVAKQAAGVDRLSGGRLRLGVSVGWNKGEFQAMGAEFGNRGKRMEEQIAVMRELWTRELVTFKGRHHDLENVSLGILSVQQPIPVWIGGYADAVLRRIARIGDGWCANIVPPDRAEPLIERLRGYVEEAGRRPEDVGISLCATLYDPQKWRMDIAEPVDWGRFAQQCRDLGVTDLEISTTSFGNLKTVEEHIDAISRFKEEVGN
jgi:probable F420-dependent oxidoreductase